MSDNAVEYINNNPSIAELESRHNSMAESLQSTLRSTLRSNRNIDFELELRNDITRDNSPSMKMKGFKHEIDTRKKTYEIEPTMNGILIKGFIDGKLVDTGICKFNRKDKLDVN